MLIIIKINNTNAIILFEFSDLNHFDIKSPNKIHKTIQGIPIVEKSNAKTKTLTCWFENPDIKALAPPIAIIHALGFTNCNKND